MFPGQKHVGEKLKLNLYGRKICLINAENLNEDITKCLDTYCNTNLYVSTTVFITQGNM